jgi:hypothetical protein
MASDGRKQQFLFLNQTFSQGPRSQREKELQDADRRAHAARHSRPRRGGAAHVLAKAAASTRRLKKSVRHHKNHITDETEPVITDSSESSEEKLLVVRPRTPISADASSPWAHVAPAATLTLSLGQGNHDPFDTSAVSRLPPFIDGVLDHCE